MHHSDVLLQEQSIQELAVTTVTANAGRAATKSPAAMESSKGSSAATSATTNTGNIAARRSGTNSIGTELTLLEVNPMRFLIMDAPRQGNVHVYLREMGKYHVTDVVRVCEPTYQTTDLQNAGIIVHEMEYKDGSSPSKELILSWLQLVEKTFYTAPLVTHSANTTTTVSTVGVSNVANGNGSSLPCIAVHCVAGLGRAPVMIAIALIEFANMDPIDAVRFIRERRRGAINNNQLNYLQGYKKVYKKGSFGGTRAGCGCIIS
jgi:protein tyrosine phosphatase type IVA